VLSQGSGGGVLTKRLHVASSMTREAWNQKREQEFKFVSDAVHVLRGQKER